MKFLHIGDLHIGKKVNDFDMLDDQKFILNQILEVIEQEKIDGILMAGDIYDKADPREVAVALLDDFLGRLAKAKVKTFIISGNHDSDERLNFGSSLFKNNDIYIVSKFDGQLHKETASDETGSVNIYMLPFVKASQVRKYYPEETIENYEDALRVVIEHTKIDQDETNIIIAHQFVSGRSGEVELGGSEGMAVQNVGTVEKVGYDIFDAFDYVALGHIHSPQQVGRPEVRYAGSILSYSASEIGREKSMPLIQIGEEKGLSFDLIPLRPCRQMRAIKGPLEKLISPEFVTNQEDYIFATLTDEDPRANAMNILREYYPNLMQLQYENSHSRQIQQVDLKEIAKGKSFQDLIGEFYASMYGTEISEEEMKIILEVAREAGVAHEAD